MKGLKSSSFCVIKYKNFRPDLCKPGMGMGMTNQLELISVYACCSTRATKGSGGKYESQRLIVTQFRLASVSGTPRGQMGLTFGRAVRGVGGPLAAGHRIRRTLESVPCTR